MLPRDPLTRTPPVPAGADGSGPRPGGIAGIVDRPRLHRLLDAPLARVCVVLGPSGSGKTTLVRSWVLQGRPGLLLWVSLGASLDNRLAFWQQVASSAVRAGALSPDEAVRAGEQLTMAVDPVRIAARLLAGAGPVVLILDAYEHLGAATVDVDADLARLVAVVPQLRIVVTSRTSSALTDRDPAGGFTQVIPVGELALTRSEVHQLIRDQAGIDDARLAAAVADATHGFALGVRSVALTLSQLGHIPEVDSVEWGRLIATPLESLLPDAATTRFVADTCVAPYVDVALAELLSENADAAELLRTLERGGFGRWIPYTRNREVFQYVETIRDTFRQRTADDDPARFRRSCVTTAAWLLENEETLDQALRFAIDGRDYALADRIFVSLLIANPDSYITGRFLAELQQVPDDVLGEHPMLAFGRGLALMTSPMLRLEAGRYFRLAADAPARPAYLDPAVDAFVHAAMRAIARRLAERRRTDVARSAEVVGLLDRLAPEEQSRFGDHLGTILRQLSFGIWQDGRIDDALWTASRSVALCRRPVPRNYSLVYVAAMGAFSGDTVGAASALASVDTEAWPPETRGTSMNGLGLLAEALVHLDRHDFSSAATTLEGTLAYLRTNEYWSFLTAARLLTKHGLGQGRAEAERIARELDSSIPPPGVGDNVGTEHLHGILAQAWLAGGDPRAARRLLDAAPEDSPHVAAARVTWLLAAGHDNEAWRRSQQLLRLSGHTHRTRSELQTLAAVAALRRGEKDAATDWLNDACVTWETHGPRLHVALLHPRDLQQLVEHASAHGSAQLLRYLAVVRPRTRTQQATTLSPRETATLQALVEYPSVRAMAEALVVSPHTVKSHLGSIYRKLGVGSRQAALAQARDLGLLE